MVVGQVLIINFGGKAFGIEPLGAIGWAISLAMGAGVFPVAVASRKFPDAWAARLLPLSRWRRRLAPDLYPPVRPSRKPDSDYDSCSTETSEQDSDASEFSGPPPPLTLKEKVWVEVRGIRDFLEGEYF
jgi:hypothetical protein